MPAKRAYGMDQDVVSVVPDYHAPGAPMAGQRPRRPRRHRQPRALGLGGAAPYAAGGQPFGRPRGAVEREPAGFSRYRRLRQPRVRQSRRHLSHPRRLGQVRHQADPGARQGRRRPLPVPDPGGAEARRGVHRARPLAPAHHPHRHVRGRGAAVYPRLDRGGRTRPPASARLAGPAPTSRRRRTPPTCSPRKASATSATGATTSSPTR